MEVRRILQPTDYSDAAERALAEAAELSVKFGAELHVLHVAERLLEVAPVGGAVAPAEADAESALDRPHQDRLEDWLEARLPAGLERTAAVRDGEAAREIVSYAREKDVDLIVMGVHGRSALERFFMGSVTESVLRRADRPVLVIPAARA